MTDPGSSTGELLSRSGVFDPLRVGALSAGMARWGPNLAGLYAAAAARRPTRAAVIDDLGEISFGALHLQTSWAAHELRDAGLGSGDELGILCRNNRDLVIASIAAAKLGLVPVYLNTGFGAPQLADVAAREGVRGIVHDAEFASIVDEAGVADSAIGGLAERVASRSGWRRQRPLLPQPLRLPVLLTSGTTGRPKGARHKARPSASATGVLRVIPYRSGDRMMIPTPLFHAWGLAQLTIAASLGNTVILTNRFEADRTMAVAADHQASTLAVVPVMLQRILGSTDTATPDSLRIVASSGSRLPAPLATAWMDRYGDTLYNLYGSTEVGQATIATPTDLRAAPGTAGKAIPGSTVEILDADRQPLPTGEIGEVFVDSGASFEGYTGGGTKEVANGMMSTGDLGRFDDNGRLFVEGRADDMIISGGENVFPREVEDLLAARSDVAEVAVVGVPDDEFGERLVAFVVPAGEVDPEAMRQQVATELARHKVPREIVVRDSLPRTTTGKIRAADLVASLD